MANTSTIHIKTDFDCKVYDYGQEIGTTKADTFCNFEFRKGEHELTFAFAEDESVSKTINYIVEDADCDYRLNVEIAESISDKAKEQYDLKNYSKAYSLFSLVAMIGLAEAQCRLGNLFETGKGIEKDSLKAEEWYTKAAEQGNAEAMYSLGRLYCEQKNDKAKAFHYFQLSSEKNHLETLVCLGCCYENGYGTEINLDKAIELTAKAAEQDCARAKRIMGLYYENGTGVEMNTAKALEWYIKAAEQGDASAQCSLGFHYKYGKGVDRDLVKAVEWYTMAAEQGFATAQNNLGNCYHGGTGVEKDLAKAVEWYNKAAEQGYASAQYNLGLCYEEGDGVEKDIAKAVEWFLKAAEQGDANAQCTLGLCYSYSKGVKHDPIKAFEWFTKAAEQGNATAQFNLGICYENGIGVNKDLPKAVKWYTLATEQGIITSKDRIRRISINKIATSATRKRSYSNPRGKSTHRSYENLRRETWDAMTDGMYGDYPGSVDDYSFLGY